MDAAALGGLLLAANRIAAPHDPGWLSLNPTPWLLVPVLSGLMHGFRWGFLFGALASAGVFACTQMIGVPMPGLLYSFSLPAAGLLAAGFGRKGASDPGATESMLPDRPETPMDPPASGTLSAASGKEGVEWSAQIREFQAASAQRSLELNALRKEHAQISGQLRARMEMGNTLTGQRDALQEHAGRLEEALAKSTSALEASRTGGVSAVPLPPPVRPDGAALAILQDERDALQSQLAETRELLRCATEARDEDLRQWAESKDPLPDDCGRLADLTARLAESNEHILHLTEAKQEIAARLEEKERDSENLIGRVRDLTFQLEEKAGESGILKSELATLTARLAEHQHLSSGNEPEAVAALRAQLSDREAALRRAEDMRDSLNARLAERTALIESLTTRAAPPKRRLPRNGALQIHSPVRRTNSAPEEHQSEAVASAAFGDQEMLLPLDADVVPLDERLRAMFAPQAGPVFPLLLQLLEDIAGVTDSALYQIDGPRLLRSALHGSEGKLPEMLPLANAEIAHLAVTRQSFVTTRQVWATVPAQASPWLAAMPWPTPEPQSSALLLIHRMHFGAGNPGMFSRIQMVCHWVALFMELHGLQGREGESTSGKALVVPPDVLHRTAADAAAAQREHGLLSSSLSFPLAASAGPEAAARLLEIITAELRPTDLAALLPADESPGGSESGVEVLLTFSDATEAGNFTGRVAARAEADPLLAGKFSVPLSGPALP